MLPSVIQSALPFARPAALPSGLVDSLGDVVVMAGTLVLALMLVALGSYAYKQLRGGGVEWPEERKGEGEGEDDDEIRRGSGEDEWDYY